MIIYGYEKKGAKLKVLSEATIECTLEELKGLIKFIEYYKKELIESSNDDVTGFFHKHYKDFNTNWDKNESDLILASHLDITFDKKK